MSTRPRLSSSTRWKKYYDVISVIPKGKVASYGQIAELAGEPGCARQVGYALAALPSGTSVPWQRVINSKGQVSFRQDSDAHRIQIQRLQAEGIEFGVNMRIDLRRFAWLPE